nr:DUF4097 family beta strand repeat-containing protein [Lentibacillus sp. JNUCC-1]
MKIWIAVAVILIVIGGVGSFLTFTSASAADEKEESHTVNVQDVTSIAIKASNEAIVIKRADQQEVTVAWQGKTAKRDQDHVNIKTDGSKLSVETVKEPWKLFSFDFGFFTKRTLEITLPDKQFKHIKLDNDNGSTHIDDLSTENLKIDTDNGSINLTNVNTSNTEARTDNGKIHLDHVDGHIKGRSYNGSITLKTQTLNQDIELKTSNGKITVMTSETPTDAFFDATTDNGSISLYGEKGGSKLIGDGTHTITLTSNNGSITVEKE